MRFCGKAFRFRQEIERSLHETKSEISWNRESWVHETKSEFVEGRGERCTKSSRNSSGKGESGCTKPSRNSSRRWRRCRTKLSRNLSEAGERACTKSCRNSAKAGERRCTKSNRISPERSPLIGAGEGEAFFPVRRKALRAEDDHLPQIEIVAMVGAFYRLLDMVHEFSMLRTRSVWRQKRSRSMPTDVCSVCPRILARRSAHWSAGAKNSFMSFARRAACSAEICARAALPLPPRSMRCGTTFSF